MPANRSWSSYRPDYRAREMRILAGWMQACQSGTVVGSAGIGKSNLLGFLSNRPDALSQYLPQGELKTVLIPVDLNNLPANDISTLFRVILRSFHEYRSQFDTQDQEIISKLYLENRGAADPFLPHSALRELLLLMREQRVRVVMVLDRFDWFCENVSTEMADTLRGLRDSFKDSICYLVGMRQEVTYLSDPAVLGELYELLDSYVCWVQPMETSDALQLIADETDGAININDEADVARLLDLTGCYPSLLKAVCHWWLNTTNRSADDWVGPVMASPNIRHRLNRIWYSLTLGEQQVLDEIVKWQNKEPGKVGALAESGSARSELQVNAEQRKSADLLIKRGLVELRSDSWRIRSSLLAAYASTRTDFSPGTIWYDEGSALLYQGRSVLDNLSPLEHSLLSYLVRQPRMRHTHTDLIEAVWPEDTLKEGVSTEALYQVVRGLRRKIEPMPSHPRYVINWRGLPEGGYQCFPEGRPGG